MENTTRSRVATAFETHQKLIYGYARYLARRLQLSDGAADDLFGEVALTAWEKAVDSPSSLPDDQSMVPWLMRIALYKALNVARKTRRESQRTKEIESILDEHYVREFLEEDSAQIRVDLKRFLNGLNESDRKFLAGFLCGGRTSGEVAAECGQNADAIRQRKARLIRQLRVHLGR